MAAMTSTVLGATSQRSCFSGCTRPLLSRPTPIARRSALAAQALFGKQKKSTGKPGKQKKGSGYDKGFEVEPTQPAFTRRREVFVGRLAMFGFAAALLGEIVTGKGALGQIQQELSLPPFGADAIIFGAIAYSLLGAVLPGSPTYSDENQKDVAKRRGGAVQNPKKNLINDPQKTLGISSFGFTRGNEVFVGRTAQLGFLAAIIGEKVTGLGPLKQFGLETGIPVGQASVGLLAFIAFFFVAAVFTGNLTDDGDKTQF